MLLKKKYIYKIYYNLNNNIYYSLFINSKINVSDNSGIRNGKCINLVPYSKTRGTKPAAIIKIAAKKIVNNTKIKKGDFCKGILVRRKKILQRDTGLSIKCNSNSIILLDNKNIPIGSRLYGIIFRELKYFDLYPKIILMAKMKL